jgi:hypothetical protein
MNPDFSLSDWMNNWGTLKLTTVSTYEWWEIGAHVWTQPGAQGCCVDDLRSGCRHVSGL